MFTKPTKRVRVVARNVHDRRSKCITLYGTDCDEVIARISDNVGEPEEPGKRARNGRPRRKAS